MGLRLAKTTCAQGFAGFAHAVYAGCVRLDKYLVERGHYPTRARAQSAIRAGCVRVDGRTATKASQMVAEAAAVEAEPEHPWVGRGGLKLDAALARWDVPVAGRRCLDVGASTGGFTDVLLSRGAAEVVAVDVGRQQLHPRLRADARVRSLEGVDARDLREREVGRFGLMVCDASFIPLRTVLAVPLGLAEPGADAVVLVKPQFEVGREGVGRGGVVRDARAREAALHRAAGWFAEMGWDVCGEMESPVSGAGGNREWLLWARKPQESPA